MRLNRIPPDESIMPTLPLFIGVSDSDYFETDCLPGLVAAVVGREYMDVRAAEAAYHMRLDAARLIAAQLGGHGQPAVVMDGDRALFDNRQVDPDEAGEMEEVEWSNSHPVIIQVRTDREFVTSLMKADVIRVAERSDSHILCYGPPWERLSGRGCGLCHYYVEGRCGVYGLAKDAGDGAKCPAFAPVNKEYSQMSDVRYVPLDSRVRLVENNMEVS